MTATNNIPVRFGDCWSEFNTTPPSINQFDDVVQSMPLTTSLCTLGTRGSDLSRQLYELQEKHTDDSTITEIKYVADELKLLCTNIFQLHDALLADFKPYTLEFVQDLRRNNGELGLYLDEIEECLHMMQKAYGNRRSIFVPWFFKKGRISRLTKHLEVIRTQLSIMRIVLYEVTSTNKNNHSMQYLGFTHPSMFTNRAILQAALAKNQESIRELIEQDEAIEAQIAASPEQHAFAMDLQRCRESNVQNGLGATQRSNSPDSNCSHNDAHHVTLRRRFTTRVREGNHTPILEISTSPTVVKSKWVKPDYIETEIDTETNLHSILSHQVESTVVENVSNPTQTLSPTGTVSSVRECPDDQPGEPCTHSMLKVQPKASANGEKGEENEEEATKTQTRLLQIVARAKSFVAPVGQVFAGAVDALAAKNLLGRGENSEHTRLV